MGNPVVHFEIVGTNPPALQNFYKQAFGWRVEPMQGGGGPPYAMAYPDADGSINGGIGGGPDGYTGHVTFYVAVPSIEETLSTVKRLGGETMMGPMDVPNGPRIALFKDPEGHVVGLVQAGTMQSS